VSDRDPSAWCSFDAVGARRRGAASMAETNRSRTAERHRWLREHAASVSFEDVMRRFGVSRQTIESDERLLGVRCLRNRKPKVAPKMRAESRERPDLLAGVREVARMMRAWR